MPSGPGLNQNDEVGTFGAGVLVGIWSHFLRTHRRARPLAPQFGSQAPGTVGVVLATVRACWYSP